MWPYWSKGLGAAGGRNPWQPAVPFRGSVEPLLGGQLIEAVALSLESELLSTPAHLGGTHGAELWPGLVPGTLPSQSPLVPKK